jgi:oligoendopeptidase F
VNNFIELLKSGGNADPIEQLKKAGADLTDKSTIEAVAAKLSNLVDILEKELN